MSITHISGAASRRSARAVAASHPVRGTSALWADGAAPLPIKFPPGDPTAVEEADYPRPEQPVPTEANGPSVVSPVRALPVAVPLRRRPALPQRRGQQSGGSSAGSKPALLGALRAKLGTDANRVKLGTDANRGMPAPRSADSLWQEARPWGSQDYPSLRRLARAVQGPSVQRQAGWARPVLAGRFSSHSSGTPRAASRQVGQSVHGAGTCRNAWGAGVRLSPGRKTWVIGALLVVAALLAIGLGLFLFSADAPGEPAAAGADTTISVAPGQTLWQIASAHGSAGQDVRDTALRIAEVNGLQDGALRAGQVLVIPADIAQ